MESFAPILGATRIGDELPDRVRQHRRDCSIGDGAQIEAFCHYGRRRTSLPGAQVGPFARLRMQADVGPGRPYRELRRVEEDAVWARGRRPATWRISVIRRSARRRTSGPGTITCNYDGSKKHPTISATARSSAAIPRWSRLCRSETAAYIAAGSVITDPVPDETLALGRSRQVLKEGWVARRREKQKQGQ